MEAKTIIPLCNVKRHDKKPDVELIYTVDKLFFAELGSVEYKDNTISFILSKSKRKE